VLENIEVMWKKAFQDKEMGPVQLEGLVSENFYFIRLGELIINQSSNLINIMKGL
jgi:hypothetical protein